MFLESSSQIQTLSIMHTHSHECTHSEGSFTSHVISGCALASASHQLFVSSLFKYNTDHSLSVEKPREESFIGTFAVVKNPHLFIKENKIKRGYELND